MEVCSHSCSKNNFSTSEYQLSTLYAILSALIQTSIEVAVPSNLSPIKDSDRLLQDEDINRLRAVVFRDVVSADVQVDVWKTKILSEN